MEVIEKKDMLNLNSDSFVRSILLSNGNLTSTNTSYHRGSLLILHASEVQQLRFQTGEDSPDNKFAPLQPIKAE
jgi:hypothetical protein